MCASTWASEGSASLSSLASLANMRGQRLRDRSRLKCPDRGMGCYIAAHIDRHIQRGGGNWPDETPATPPRTTVRRGRCQVQQATSLGDVSGSPTRTSAHRAEVFFVSSKARWDEEQSNGSDSPDVQGMRHGVPARGSLRLRGLLRAARGHIRLLGLRGR